VALDDAGRLSGLAAAPGMIRLSGCDSLPVDSIGSNPRDYGNRRRKTWILLKAEIVLDVKAAVSKDCGKANRVCKFRRG
jgi:hypothetical protein